MFSVNHQTH